MAQNFDRRRINGPENSAPPVFEDEDEDASPYAKWATGQPRIGRAADDIRPICAPSTYLICYFEIEITASHETWIDHSSQRLGISGDGANQTRVRCVSDLRIRVYHAMKRADTHIYFAQLRTPPGERQHLQRQGSIAR